MGRLQYLWFPVLEINYLMQKETLVLKSWEPEVWFSCGNSITLAANDLRIGMACNSFQEEACWGISGKIISALYERHKEKLHKRHKEKLQKEYYFVRMWCLNRNRHPVATKGNTSMLRVAKLKNEKNLSIWWALELLSFPESALFLNISLCEITRFLIFKKNL